MGFPKQEIEIRKVAIGPVKCYFEAKEFLGDQYWLFFGICLASIVIAGIVPVAVMGPAYAGMVLCMLKRAHGERVTFEDMFKGFDFFMPSFIATVVYVVVALILAIPFVVMMMSGVFVMGVDGGDYVLIGLLLLAVSLAYWIVVISILIMIYMFAICLVVDKKLDGVPAMKAAAQGVFKNLRGVCATSFVGNFIYILAAMMCMVPAFLVLPIIFTGHFIAYWKIFGIRASDVVVADIA